MTAIRRILFQFARTRLAGAFIRLGFAYMSFAIPVQRLRETSSLLAFYHPSPSYPVHILLVPKRAYRSLMDIPKGNETFLSDVVETVQDLVRSLRLEEGGYRLIANGGSFQDVPLLHFHLVAGKETGG